MTDIDQDDISQDTGVDNSVVFCRITKRGVLNKLKDCPYSFQLMRTKFIKIKIK